MICCLFFGSTAIALAQEETEESTTVAVPESLESSGVSDVTPTEEGDTTGEPPQPEEAESIPVQGEAAEFPATERSKQNERRQSNSLPQNYKLALWGFVVAVIIGAFSAKGKSKKKNKEERITNKE